MLRLTQFYCNRVAATITIQCWRRRTTQSLVLQKYVALYRQRAQSHLLQQQDAARIIRHCYQRFVIRRQLRLPELARACAEAAATLDVAKAAAASLPVDSNSFDVWIAESRHRHTIAMFDYQLQQIARRIDWIDCHQLRRDIESKLYVFDKTVSDGWKQWRSDCISSVLQTDNLLHRLLRLKALHTSISTEYGSDWAKSYP